MQWLHSIKNDSERSFGVILCYRAGKTYRQKTYGYKKFNKHPIFKILCINIKKNTSDIVINFQVLKPKISQKLKKKKLSDFYNFRIIVRVILH